MLDFSETSDQRAFGAAVAAVVQSSGEEGAEDASDSLWQRLAEVGALGLLAEGGDVRDLVTLMDVVGRTTCPGPVLATVTSVLVLPDALRDDVVAGNARVSLAVEERVPWGGSADHVLELEGSHPWLVDVERTGALTTLSQETWVAVRARRREQLADSLELVVATDLGLAAALLGMAHRLLDRAAAHVVVREQFGRPIGSFQAVAHPLAGCWATVTATGELLRLVATETMHDSLDTERSQLVRWQARDAALQTAYATHQAMGGLSFADESGIGTVSTRIRQWSYLVPDRPLVRHGC